MEIDKPVSLSMKAWIIRNMSVRIAMQEIIIETIVNHQFDSAYTALETCNSMEFSGFGKFLFNVPKAYKKIERMKELMNIYRSTLDDENAIETKKKNAQLKLDTMIKSFNYLNKKLDGMGQNLRGMEKSSVSSEAPERANTEGDNNEDGDLQLMREQLQISQLIET